METPIKFKDAQTALRLIGCTLRKLDGEYRLNRKGGTEATAYYTSDLGDAIQTAVNFYWV